MTIKQRLGMFVCLAIIFIVFSAWLAWYFFDHRVGQVNSYKEEIARISNQIIEGRVLEKRYLQFLTKELKEEFALTGLKVQKDLATLKNFSDQDDAGIDKVGSLFISYVDLFNDLCKTIEENAAVYSSSIEPIFEVRKDLAKIQTAISEKQLELQMEGEQLDSNYLGLVTLSNEASAILFRLQTLQQEFLVSGKGEFLDEYKGILEKQLAEISAGLVQIAKIVKDEEITKNAEKLGSFLKLLKAVPEKLDASFNKHQMLLRQLDESGNKVIQGTDNLRVTANDLIIREKAKAFVYLGALIGSSLIIFILFSIAVAVKITRPISEVTALVKEIAKGNLNVEISHESNDEIGVMTAAFKEMVKEQRKKIAVAQSISEGDFTSKIDLSSQDDSLGQAFNHMSGSLADVLSNINVCASNVSIIAKRVYEGSEQLSAGSVRSASSLEELSSSLNEIGAQVKSNAENAQIASKAASVAMNSANIGNERMNKMNLAMGEIRASSDKIRSILKVIEDIAFQTNLLALNAAVEAARAGRHGKGFAVVAEEVRNLAARSAKAAKETSELIENSSNMVDQGAGIARNTVEALAEIVESITATSGLVEKISKASSEQSLGVSEINAGLDQIDKVTQQNAVEAEKSLSDAQNLAQQAEKLQDLLSQFVLPD
ncbi:MAG: methyl-accepting chemotaxis protein [Candidatus Rifleibacteriota bacterium]